MKSRIRFSSLLGAGAGLSVVYFGVVAHSVRPEIFLDQHALILVLGGTAAAGLLAFPFRQFRELWDFVTAGAFFPPEKNLVRTAESLLRLSGRNHAQPLDVHLAREFHPFLAEGYALMLKQTWTANEFKNLLGMRMQMFKDNYAQDAKALAALAKYPPAFGLLGATSGMIAMMSNLGPSSRDSIGPSMAIALVATFWGIALANLVLLPLADHALRLNAEDARLRFMIASGLYLIHQGASPAALHEHVISFLPVAMRDREEIKSALITAEAQARLAAPKVRAV